LDRKFTVTSTYFPAEGAIPMRTFFIVIVILLFVLSLALLIFTRTIAPGVVRRQLVSSFEETCAGCTLDIDRVRLSFVPVSVILEGVHMSAGDPKATAVDARADRIIARTSLYSMVLRRLLFRRIQVHAPHVMVTEGDLPLHSSKHEEGRRKIFVIEGVELIDGTFTYVRVFGTGERARKATLHVKDIQASVGKLGNAPSLLDQMVKGVAKGKLENSGHFLLSVETPLFSKALNVDVDLQMAEQNLADVSQFFQTSDGIRISGILREGRSSMKIRGKQLGGSVRVKYDKLDVQFERTKSRGAISTFSSNLVKSFKLNPSSMGERATDQTGRVELERETGETLVHLILRGMKEAALKVAGMSQK
jgi:hypothetical protein